MAESSPTRAGKVPLRDDELRETLSAYPPILNVKQAAQLLHLSPSTLYHQVSRGQHRNAVKRGRPLLFFRDRLVRDVFRNSRR